MPSTHGKLGVPGGLTSGRLPEISPAVGGLGVVIVGMDGFGTVTVGVPGLSGGLGGFGVVGVVGVEVSIEVVVSGGDGGLGVDGTLGTVTSGTVGVVGVLKPLTSEIVKAGHSTVSRHGMRRSLRRVVT